MVHPEILSATAVDDQRPPVTGRRRSVSVADSSPSVETVMSKAKRAAVSLWMLLHAQVRRRRLWALPQTSVAGGPPTRNKPYSLLTLAIILTELRLGPEVPTYGLPRS